MALQDDVGWRAFGQEEPPRPPPGRPPGTAPDVGYQIVNLSIQQRLPGVVALKIHQPKAKAPPRQVGSRQ